MFILSLGPLLMTAHMLLSFPTRRLREAARARGEDFTAPLVFFMLVATVIALSAPILPFVLALRQIYGAGLSLATFLFSNFTFVRDTVITAIVFACLLLYLNVYTRITKTALRKQTIVEGLINALFSPFVEEVVFRGYGKMYCDAHHISNPLAASLTAVLFSVGHLHIGGVLEAFSSRRAVLNFIQDTVAGIVFYYLYLTTGSLMTPIMSHFAVNAAFFFSGRKQIKEYRL